MESPSPLTCRQLAAELTRAAPVVARLELDLPDCRIRVHSDDPALLNALRPYYREHLRPATAGAVDLELLALHRPPPDLPPSLVIRADDKGRPPKEAWVDLADGRIVHKIRTGVVILSGGGVDLICGPLGDHLDQVINFIHHRAIGRWLGAGGHLAHAAGIALGDRGLVLCGDSGAGKSTLALAMMTADPQLAFVSNDRLVITRAGAGADTDTATDSATDSATGPRLLGIPKHPRINPGTILHNPALAPLLTAAERRRYAAMSPAELRPLEEKRDAIIDELYGPGRVRLAARAVAVVILRWRADRSEPFTATPVDLGARRDLQGILHKRRGLFYWPLAAEDPGAEDPGALALAAALAGVPAFEITGGIDFAGATAWAGGLLRGGG